MLSMSTADRGKAGGQEEKNEEDRAGGKGKEERVRVGGRAHLTEGVVQAFCI